MSSKLSPSATWKSVLWPSLSTNETLILVLQLVPACKPTSSHPFSTHSSPGFGGVRFPCCALAVAENDRTGFTPGLPNPHATRFRLVVGHRTLLEVDLRKICCCCCGRGIESYRNRRDWPRTPPWGVLRERRRSGRPASRQKDMLNTRQRPRHRELWC